MKETVAQQMMMTEDDRTVTQREELFD